MCELNKKNEIFDHMQEAAENQRKNDFKYDFWLASLTNINSRKRIQVRELCGNAQAVYELREETLKNMHLFTDNELQHLLESRKKDLNRAWERFLGQNIHMFPIGSRDTTATIRNFLQRCHARCQKKCRHRRRPDVLGIRQKHRHKTWKNAGGKGCAGHQRHGSWD